MKIIGNNLNFNGRREVIYALKQAAFEANDVSAHYRQLKKAAEESPNVLYTYKDISPFEAYLDMACYDSKFDDAIAKIDSFQISILHRLLQRKKTSRGIIEPMPLFKQYLTKWYKFHWKSANSEKLKKIDDFCERIENYVPEKKYNC